MPKTPQKWYLGQDELLVNPPVPPKHGVWMEIDYSKLGKRPKVDPKVAAIREIRTLVAMSRARLHTTDQIIAQIREIMSKVSD